jgi:hypothetical protein
MGTDLTKPRTNTYLHGPSISCLAFFRQFHACFELHPRNRAIKLHCPCSFIPYRSRTYNACASRHTSADLMAGFSPAGFITTPRTVGRTPRQRLAPALPSFRRLCSPLPTTPMTARVMLPHESAAHEQETV